MATVSTFKRSVLGLAAVGVFATTLFGGGSASAAGPDSLAGTPDPTAVCWTKPDGSVWCKACVTADGIKSCFAFKKAPAPSTSPSTGEGGRTISDYNIQKEG